MNGGDNSDGPVRNGRSLSFPHGRLRHSYSSDEEDESPSGFQDEYDDDNTRDSLSEFAHVTLNEKNKNVDQNDDLPVVTRKRTFSNSDPNSADADATTNGKGPDKRVATKICRVCGDKAYSYNFSVVTCESCKAFFRRNANKDKDIRCPFNDNCDINIVSRRFCQKCRLAKCFKVGMKKEWIMSEEARREKKQRIQDNRERRMAEQKAQEEKMAMQMISPIIDSDPTNGAILPNLSLAQSLAQAPTIPTIVPPVAASIVSIPPPVQSIVASQTESASVMQQALQQAQQVQNAQQQALQQAQQVQNVQILAQVAMQNQSDAIVTIQQAAQIASMPSPNTNAIAAAGLNHLAQVVAMQQQTPSETIASIQQAAQINSIATIPTFDNPNVKIQQEIIDIAQMQQQINANLAAQRIQASQNLAAADQQQLAAAISNQTPSSEPIQPPPQLPSAILPTIIPPTNPILPTIISTTNPAPLASVEQSLIQPVLPPVPNNEMIAVRKDVLMEIVQENIENRQAQIQQQLNTPPAKCRCFCQCGRYSSDSVIVDKVIADMLMEAKKNATGQHVVESMDCSRHDIDCCLLSEEDKIVIHEIEQADKIFWTIQTGPMAMDSNAADFALRKLIRMVTSLNFFSKFSRVDQCCLLKHGCASHFAIRQAMGNIIENPQNLMVVQFYNSLREEWRTNHQLMLLLSVLVVFDSDAPNLENKPQIIHECARLKSILKRMLYTIYQDPQRTILEFDDLINKLNVLQTLNNNISSSQNGVESHLAWSAEVLEPLLSRELFEPNIMSIPSAVNITSTIPSMI